MISAIVNTILLVVFVTGSCTDAGMSSKGTSAENTGLFITPFSATAYISGTNESPIAVQSPTSRIMLPLILNGTEDNSNSGLRGVTSIFVVGGEAGADASGGPESLEFAIAPIEGTIPNFEQATYVMSDDQGRFELVLPPGTYWIGASEKARDPNNYEPGFAVVSEHVVNVPEGTFVQIDVVKTQYAP